MSVLHLINATIDGRCDHRNVVADDDLHTHALQAIGDADAILYGSGTYRLLAPHWSKVAAEQSATPAVNQFASVLMAKPKIVFSSSAEPWPGWNTTVERRDPRSCVAELLDGGAHRLTIQASPQLARTLRRAGLVDELHMLLQPLVGDSGPVLFEPDERYELTLKGIARTRSGAAALTYAFGASVDV
jgi:dihydrofolate reductase